MSVRVARTNVLEGMFRVMLILTPSRQQEPRNFLTHSYREMALYWQVVLLFFFFLWVCKPVSFLDARSISGKGWMDGWMVMVLDGRQMECLKLPLRSIGTAGMDIFFCLS